MINSEQWEQRRFLDALRVYLGMAPLYCEEQAVYVWCAGDGCRMMGHSDSLSSVYNAANHEKTNRREMGTKAVDVAFARSYSNSMREMQRRRGHGVDRA